MDENTLKKVVEEAIKPLKNQIDGVISRLDDPDTGLKRLNERVESNTGAIMELEKTVKGYADSYKINDTNIRKAVKRVETLEDKAGVSVPEGLQLAAMSDI